MSDVRLARPLPVGYRARVSEVQEREKIVTPAVAVKLRKRRRRRRLLISAVVALLLLGGVATWYVTTIVLVQPVALAGGARVAGDGTTLQQDPYSGQWYAVAYKPGLTSRETFNITNTGHYPIHVTKIVFQRVTKPGQASPVLTAAPLMALGDNASDGQMVAFQPFDLAPTHNAFIGFDLTTCPSAPADPGGNNKLFGVYQMTFSYAGWTHTEILPLGAALQYTNAGECDHDGQTVTE